MRICLLLAVALFALAACGDEAPAPVPPADTFAFDSGGAFHIQGHGAWKVHATRTGTFEVRHQVGDEVKDYPARELAPEDRDTLWKAIDASGLPDLEVKDRPGVPDEAQYTFVLNPSDGAIAVRVIWQNDLTMFPMLDSLRTLLKELIEKLHAVKPVF